MKTFLKYYMESDDRFQYFSPNFRLDKKRNIYQSKKDYEWFDWDEPEPSREKSLTEKQANYLSGLYPGFSLNGTKVNMGDYIKKVMAYFKLKGLSLSNASKLIEFGLFVKNNFEKGMNGISFEKLLEFLELNNIRMIEQGTKNRKLITKEIFDEINDTVFAPYIEGEEKREEAGDYWYWVILKPYFGTDLNKQEIAFLRSLKNGSMDRDTALNFLSQHKEKIKKFDEKYKREGLGGIATAEQKRKLIEKYGSDRKKWSDDVIENINFISQKDAQNLLSSNPNSEEATPAQIKLITQLYGKFDRSTRYGKFKENVMAEVKEGITKSRANELIKNKAKYKEKYEKEDK